MLIESLGSTGVIVNYLHDLLTNVFKKNQTTMKWNCVLKALGFVYIKMV